MKIHRAVLKDLPDIRHLLQMNELPVEGVTENIKNFLVLKEKGRILGCLGLEVGDTACLLRSLAVAENVRRKGYGHLLINEAFQLVKKKNIKKIYLLTTDATGYFGKFDFRIINRPEMDSEIRKIPQFNSSCCQSALCMVKTIK